MSNIFFKSIDSINPFQIFNLTYTKHIMILFLKPDLFYSKKVSVNVQYLGLHVFLSLHTTCILFWKDWFPYNSNTVSLSETLILHYFLIKLSDYIIKMTVVKNILYTNYEEMLDKLITGKTNFYLLFGHKFVSQKNSYFIAHTAFRVNFRYVD